MPSFLNQRIEQVERTASQLFWLYAWSRFVAAAVAIVAGFGAIDYLLRLQNPVARWLLSGVVVALVVAAFIKLVWPALAFRQSRVGTSRQIEACFPQLGEQLSSAIAFLQQPLDDPTAGSPRLRLAVIAEAEALAKDIDFTAALDSRPIRGAVLLAAVCAGAATIFVVANPLLGSLSVSRLATPWRDHPWPRRHELVVVNPPRRVAAGSDVEIAVIDARGRLPDSVQLQLREDSPPGAHIVTHEMKPLGEQMVFRIDNVAHDFEFRARGSDDDTMPWLEVNVVEPPKLIDLAVTMEPPAYTGLPPQTGGRLVRGLAGSKLRVTGKLDKPIRTVVAHSQDAEFSLPPVDVAANGLGFTAPSKGTQWLMDRSGTLWFELIDSEGLVLARDIRIEVQAIADTPPTIAWDMPSSEATFVTAQAVVPVKGLVKDDIAIRQIELRYVKSGSQAEQTVELFAASPDPSRVTTPGSRSPPQSSSRSFAGETRAFDHIFDLAKIAELAPGDELTLFIAATDNQPKTTTTAARRVTIITPEQLTARIATGQGAILRQMAEALRLARQLHEQTSATKDQFRAAEQLPASHLSRLQGLEHRQRQLQQLLDGSYQGVEGQLAALLEQLAANRVPGQGLAERLSDLHRAVGNLNRQTLPQVTESLAAAFKRARDALEQSKALDDAAAKDLAQSLQTAEGLQEEAILTLERTLGTLSEWDSFSRLAREVGQIHSDEQHLANETEALHLQTIAAAAPTSPTQTAAATQLSERQLDLARKLDKLQVQMEETLTGQQATDPAAAGPLSAALVTARRLAIGGKMREASVHLSEWRLGPGHQMQQGILQALAELLTALIPTYPAPPESLPGTPGTHQETTQDQSSPQNAPGEAERRIVQLQNLLRQQQEINRRTAAIEALKATASAFTAEQKLELGTLAEEQRQIAEALQDLVKRSDQLQEASR